MANAGETPEMLLARRISGFDSFKSERMPVLHEFCKSLGFDEPHEVLNQPEKFLPMMDSGFKNAVISEENRAWFITRIGYYIGEYLISLYDGLWLVDKDPSSPTFARYVVGDFSYEGVITQVVDPFEMAQCYADTPVPRFLKQEIEKKLVGE
ncbi:MULTISPECIES: hypothetical protein [Gammaproteobacteria]|uniref:hypothetical protein n=1 Tax=Gammaproteobacteria TaxID=1236 RepID=UPI00191283CB|nr:MULTISPECIES: hypothetical protein [Gammaproteobacteria]MBK5302014.1 hypothetical protein [Bacillus sp. TH86]MBK5321783.1 hypothetical protein [Bacillus sp. TH59]MBK5336733.1 hypothetical protein [Bacillus sp. TH57]MBK5310796.1 hypothetical protein [Pseudomonas sp. TH71]MBK5316280.1 hypothetical protein [Erwinia sp. TH79]